ncbi:MAG TPA: hypothetical protein VEZ90_17850, partial [Blastocatellia bacterium]|nr:hypothetical protein [Blastocatellia bacterium]
MFRRTVVALNADAVGSAGRAVATDGSPYGGAVAAARAPRRATDVTIKLRPGFYPIPKRFELQLNSGTDPEAVISELLMQKAEMRNLLERIARSNDNDSPALAEAARSFLLSHCIVCGASMSSQEPG